MLKDCPSGTHSLTDLRERAEQAMRSRLAEIAEMDSGQIQRMVHELQVHQIELEMQNEELRRVQLELAQSRDRFNGLYEFSPVGYATLDQLGVIIEANQTLATMLGGEREEILGRNFTQFVCSGGQDTLYLHRLAVLKNSERQSCQLAMQRVDGMNFCARLETINLKDPLTGNRHSRMAVIDNTECKRLESEILRISEEERLRVSADLHDGICQELAGTQCLLHLLCKDLEKNEHDLAVRARVIQEAIGKTTEHTRQVARGMSPVVADGSGLMDALWQLSETTESSYHLACSFQCAIPVTIDDARVANELYRIAQEAICNAIRHGAASRILIRLSEAGRELCLAVIDDGQGLPLSPCIGPGMGIRVMTYRAGSIGGELCIRAGREGGTEVICRLLKPEC